MSDFLAELTAKVKVAVSQVRPEVKVRVDADTKPAEAAITSMLARIKTVAEHAARLKLDADDTGVKGKLTGIQAQAVALAKQLAALVLKADTSKLDAQIKAEEAKIAVWANRLANLKAGADTTVLNAKIDASMAKIAALKKEAADIKFGALDPGHLLTAEAALLGMESAAEKFQATLAKSVPMPVVIELTGLRSQVGELARELSDLRIDGDDKALKAKLAGLELMAVTLQETLKDTEIGGDPVKMARARRDYADLIASTEKFRAALAKPVQVAATPQLIMLRKLADGLADKLLGMRASISDAGARARLDALFARAVALRETLEKTEIGGSPAKLAAAVAAITTMTAAMNGLTPAITATEGAWAKLQAWAFKGGGFWGLGGAIGGVKIWHVALDVLLETIIAVTASVIALGTGIAALSESAVNIGQRIQAVRTVSSALGTDIAPLTGKFDALMKAMAPRSIELFGGALGVINSQSANLQKIIEPVVDLFTTWMAKLDIWVGKQASFAGVVRSGTGYLAQFGEIVGNVTDAIHNLLTKDPGIAHYFVQFFVAVSQVLDAISRLPKPLVETAIALHGVYLWGLVLTGVFTKMLAPLGSVVGWIAKFGTASGEAAGAAGVLGGALGRAGGTLKTFGLGLASLAANPLTWVIVAAAAIAAIVYQMHQGTAAAKQFIGGMTDELNQMQASNAIPAIEYDIGRLNDKIRTAFSPQTVASIESTFQGGIISIAGFKSAAAGAGVAINSLYHGVIDFGKGDAAGVFHDLASAIGGVFNAPHAAAVHAAEQDLKQYRAELDKLRQTQGNYFREVGVLVTAHHTVAQSFALMDLAGVKASDSFEVMNQKVKNLITGYKSVTGEAGMLEASVNAVTFATLQQQEKVQQLNNGWDTFMKTITGGEQAFTSFATQTEGLYQSLANGGVKLSDSNGKVSMSTRLAADAAQGGKVSMTGLNTASLQARDTFLRTADAANQQMDALSVLANAAGLGDKGVSMLGQANKDLVASMLPAAKGSQAMTDILYALAQRGGYTGADSFKDLSAWVGKTKDPMKDLDGITTTFTTHAASLTDDVKNLSIALGQTLNAAMSQAIITANGGQAIFVNFADAVLHTGLYSDRTHDTALQLAQSLVNLTGSTKDAHDQFMTFAQTALHLTSDQAKALWDSISHSLKPAMNEVTGTAKDAKTAFEDWAKNGLGASKDKADILWKEITAKYGPGLANFSLTAKDAKAKFYDFAMNGLGLSKDKAAALWQELGQEKLTEAGRKADTTMTSFENMAKQIGISTTNADNLFTALHNLPANTDLKVTMSGDGTFKITGSDGKTYSISPGGFLSPHAQGGFISGGTPGRDSVGALLMPGEVVVPTAMVAAGEVDHLRGRLPGFAAGGTVGNMPPPIPDPRLHAALYGVVPRYGGAEVTPHGAAGLFAVGVPGFADGGKVGWGLTPDYVSKIYGSFTSIMAKSMEDYIAAGVNSANRAVSLLAGPAAGQSVLAYAETFKGKVPYVWGGSSPVTGWDCSGFVSWVYDKFGIYKGRTDAAGLQNWAKSSGATPGGLVFFGLPAHHVGFVKDGKTMLSALGRQWGTIESSLAGNSGYGIPPQWAAQMRGLPGGIGFAPGPAASGSAAAAQALARSILWAYGWGANQWPPLLSLWDRESGWNDMAVNPTSGAYGIPQALPSAWDHPFNLGDYANQVRWGLAYISGKWGSPANAWGGYAARGNWYDNGGALRPGVTMAVNTTGQDETILPMPPHEAARIMKFAGGGIAGYQQALSADQAAEILAYNAFRAAATHALAHAVPGSYAASHHKSILGEMGTLARRQASEAGAYKDVQTGTLTKTEISHLIAALRAEIGTSRDVALGHLPGGTLISLRNLLAKMETRAQQEPDLSAAANAASRYYDFKPAGGRISQQDFWTQATATEAAEKAAYAAVTAKFKDSLAHAKHGSWDDVHRAVLTSELKTLALHQNQELSAWTALAKASPGQPAKAAMNALAAAALREAGTVKDKDLNHVPGGWPDHLFALYQQLGGIHALAGRAVGDPTKPATWFTPPSLPKPGTPAYITLAGIYGWYDRGGILPPGLTMAWNGTGRGEVVSPVPPGGVIGPGGMTPGEMQVINRLDKLIAMMGAAPAAYSQALNGVAGQAASRGFYSGVR